MSQPVPMQPSIGFPVGSEIDELRRLVWNTWFLAGGGGGGDVISVNGLNGVVILREANILPSPTSVISGTDIDWSLAKTYSKTLSANTTFTFSNDTDGQTIVVAITNTAGNYTVAWPAAVQWSGGTEPVQTTGAFTDVYTFVKIGSTVYASVVQNFS